MAKITQTIYPLKRGDTFRTSWAPTFTDDDQGPFDFSGWSVRSQVRDPDTGALISELTVDWIDHPAGAFDLYPPDSTQGWVIKDLLWDIEFTTDTDEIKSSPTMLVRMSPDVTRTDPSDPPS